MNFFNKHGEYFSTIYTIAFWIGGIYAFFQWILYLFETAQSGNVVGFLLAFVLQSLIQMFNTVLFGIIWGTIAVIACFIPYLAIRGLSK